MKQVTIYTTAYCGFCFAAKRLLTSLNVPFQEVDISDNDNKREELFTKYNWRTVPAIFVGDEFMGGYEDVARMHARGEFLPKLND